MKLDLQSRYTLAIGGLMFTALMMLLIAMTAENRSFTRDLERATSSAMEGALQRQGEKQALSVASVLAGRLIHGLRDLDVHEIAKVTAETRMYPSVLSVHVLDPNGTVIDDGTPANAAAGTSIPARWSKAVLTELHPIVSAGMESLRVTAPVMDGARLLGVAVVEFSRVDSLAEVELERGNLAAMIRSKWVSMAATGAAAGLTLVALSMLAAAIVANRLALPISALAMRARAIGRGERDAPDWPGVLERSDELGDLARAFKEMAAALQSTTVSKEYVDNILQSMAEMLVVTNAAGTIVTANHAFLHEIGFEGNEARGLPLERFVPGLPPQGVAPPRPKRPGETAPHYELRRADGTTTPVQVSATPLRESGGAGPGHVYVMQNVAERLAASRQIERSLRENEILLKEIHHRVKNNLQIISSMLSLQAARTEDKRSRAVFIESESRIRAMALIHEQLYRSGDLARVDIGEYLENLSRQIARYLGRLDCKVEISCDFDEVAVDVAIPCGLIVNELVTNCIQHAFPDGRAGTVSVWFTAAEDERILIVSDDGVGLDPDVDLDSGATLGIKLVRALADQLGGRLEILNDGGATFRVTFPASKKQPEQGDPAQAPTRAA
ncbi:MAG TPA: histidine kinase dimerization/phosphoacceptor domain -containing protein [Candidatus Limnocylindrales bacterium]|nr:histidine kinase dimerization/phosphoacceptor domain -containing protein [Candidatus Limnocylindrales bacterium]